MANLPAILALVNDALHQAPPHTRLEVQLCCARRQLVELIWRETGTRSPEIPLPDLPCLRTRRLCVAGAADSDAVEPAPLASP